MRKMLRHAALAAALALTMAAPAGATTYAEMSDQAMTVASDAIVVGRVAGSKSQWIGKQLVTVVDMNVSETLKGDAKSKMQVILPGGVDLKRAVPVAMTYPGAPTLRANESVVLFLSKTSLRPGAMVISGFSQGKYNIVTDAAGRSVVTRSESEVAHAGHAGHAKALLPPPNRAAAAQEKARTLGEFRLEIREYLNQRAR
jgi:hypothetical protein